MDELVSCWLHDQLGSSILVKKAPFSMGSSQLVKVGTEKYLLKYYEKKGNFEREIAGLTFAYSNVGIRTPKIITINKKLSIALYEYIPGKPLTQLLRDNPTN